ncbi:hypothetical protein [Saccharopolyspora sp. 6V]|uniref:hypothetical protein n=1 Tax=Saccharopolyspora sp. 6V TaxID=2877239 RepID=UPI001CD53BC0|nr:hypothetical protein [Saccharopolyspora sp. 6V]MCA1195118.1 hypothetical protein [Saccharopolyspora sp. 6V]
MTAKLRIMADDPAELDAIQAAIAASGLEVAGRDRDYPNRSGFGVRRYLEVHVPDRIRATATRTDRSKIGRNTPALEGRKRGTQ